MGMERVDQLRCNQGTGVSLPGAEYEMGGHQALMVEVLSNQLKLKMLYCANASTRLH